MKRIHTLLTLLTLSLTSIQVFAQNNKVDFDKFMEETQISKNDEGKLTVGWWIPVEFWEITFESDESMSETEKKDFIDLLSPYTMFAVVDGKIGPFGGVTYGSEEYMTETMTLLNTWGAKHKPMNVEELPADIQNLLAVFKPILKNMIGEMGENMNFFVFDDLSDNNERLFDPEVEGKLELQFNETQVVWNTPVSSLLPLKVCPKDNAKLNGVWSFCPFHGDKLKVQKD